RAVLRALGHGEVGQLLEGRVGGQVRGVHRDAVVAEVPDEGVVVGQDAEVVGHAVGVDVPDLGRVAGVRQRLHVQVGVLGRGDRGRVVGVDAGVVLVGDHQHVGVGVGRDDVGEGLAGDASAAGAHAGEPHLDLVAGARPGDGAADLGVVVVVGVAVTLAAVPLADARGVHAAAVDAVLQPQPGDLAVDPGGDGLRVAVGHREGVDAEVLGTAAHHRHRVGRVLRGLGDREGERQVLLELGLHEVLVVGELEHAAAV